MTAERPTLAQCRLELYRRTYGDLSYDEMVQLVKELDSTISYLPVGDPAYGKFTMDRRAFLMMMQLIDTDAKVKRFEHCRPVRALCAVDDKVFERTFRISRLLWKPFDLVSAIKGILRDAHKGVVVEVELIDTVEKEKGLW